MPSIGDWSRQLRSTARLTASDAQRILGEAKAGGVTPQEKADLAALVAKFRDGFDDDGWRVFSQGVASLGVPVPATRTLSLAGVEFADIAAGRKSLSSSENRLAPAVATMQRALLALACREGKPEFALPSHGADGIMGPETTRALKAFQQSRGISETGAFDAATLARLRSALEGKEPASGRSTDALKSARFAGDEVLGRVARGDLSLSRGASGPVVKKVQQALLDLGYAMPNYGADGLIGNEAIRALSQFQRDRGLPPSGRLDAATLREIDRTAPLPGSRAVRYPEYNQMFADGVLDVTVGLGYDEDGSDISQRRRILEEFATRGFTRLDAAKTTDAELRTMGLDPAKIDRQATYYTKTFKADGRDVRALVRFVDRDSPTPKAQFGKGVASSDLVIYDGHARYGSGPDFDAKESSAGNFIIGVNAAGHRNGTLTASYDSHMRQLIKDAPNDLERTRLTSAYQLMFFSGCTTKHYLDEIRGIPANKNEGNLDFVGSNDVLSWANTTKSIFAMLDGVMATRSINDIESDLVRANGGSTFAVDGFGGNQYRK